MLDLFADTIVPIPAGIIRSMLQPFFTAIGADINNYIATDGVGIIEESIEKIPPLQQLIDKYADYKKHPGATAYDIKWKYGNKDALSYGE